MAASVVPLPLVDAARLIGHYSWIESRSFEVLGGWVATVPEPAAKLLLDEHARHHAWHAELWWDRLPEVAGMGPGPLTVPANPSIDGFVAALAAPAPTIERLVGVYRVLHPRLVTAYAAHLEAASPITDGPTIRALTLVLADVLADWRQGEKMIQGLLSSAGEVQRAAAHQAQLEARLVAAGGIAGPPTATD